MKQLDTLYTEHYKQDSIFLHASRGRQDTSNLFWLPESRKRYQGVADSSLSDVQCKVVSPFRVVIVHTIQKVLDP